MKSEARGQSKRPSAETRIGKSEVRKEKYKKFLITSYFLLTTYYLLLGTVHAERIKDIASIKGVRENQLIGYGLIVGLNGTGDKGDTTLQSIVNMLFRMGIAVDKKDIKSNNAAAVMVTAMLPPFPKIGNKIDAVVSALGDAKDLQGGTLLLTPLKGPDGKVYALAQGPVSIGGFSAGGEGARAQKNHPTVGRVPNGVTIEKEIGFSIEKAETISVILHRSDFTTASNMKNVINTSLNGYYAMSPDAGTINISVPSHYRDRVVDFVTFLEALEVVVDVSARVVINERTGTVVIGKNVRISAVAIAHGSLTIEIKTESLVSQPPPFAPESSETIVVPDTDIIAKEQEASLIKVSGVTLGEIVTALNALGVTPRDLIAILQALKAAGALRAGLEII